MSVAPVPNVVVAIDARRIADWESFHDVFAKAFGFPGFYGQNMDAWVDCMTCLDAPEDAMTNVHAPPGGIVVLQLNFVRDFSERCPALLEAIVQATAFVNWRRLEVGEGPVLALSFYE